MQSGTGFQTENFKMLGCRHGPMLVNKNDTNIGPLLSTYGEYSEAAYEVFAKLIRPGSVVLDIGANIGAHAIHFAKLVGPTGDVYAFEPQESVFYNLCANVLVNELANVHCRRNAVGSAAGSLAIPRLDFRKRASFGSLRINSAPGDDLVDVVRVDDLPLKACHFMKIDVEGMECDAIAGAKATIGKFLPFIYTEADHPDKNGALIAALRAMNYDLYWHTSPYCRAPNYNDAPVEFFKNTFSIDILAVPSARGLKIEGLPPIGDSTWPANVRRP